jgi:hypothetical protein
MIEKFAFVVMVGLVPTIQPSIGSEARETLDPRDPRPAPRAGKPEDDAEIWRRGLANFAIGTSE